MSYDIHVWAPPAPATAPADLPAAVAALKAEAASRGPAAPAFAALGRAMRERFGVRSAGSAEGTWLADPVAQAHALATPAWTIEMPGGDERVQALHLIVSRSRELGLAVLDPQLAMAFWPDGTVLPAHKAQMWAGLEAELAQSRPKPPTKAEWRDAVGSFILQALKPHGFNGRRGKDGRDLEFIRDVPCGRQTVWMTLESGSPFRCTLWCEHCEDEVESIYAATINPAGLRRTINFNAGIFEGNFNDALTVDSRAEVMQVVQRLQQGALPVLDLARTPAGLDAVLNEAGRFPLAVQSSHPSTPRTLDQAWRRWDPQYGYRGLIVAWKVGNPRFEALVDEMRELSKQHFAVKLADIERLVQYLRERVPRGA